MTRINVVPVELLTDKHCLAEYKEITRPFNKVIKRIADGTMDKVSIPEKYCLGAGHETFFFDKLMWLWGRYEDLFFELEDKRKFKMDFDKFSEIQFSIQNKLQNTKYWKDYIPSQEDIYLNFSRLCKRSNVQSVLDELKEG